MCERAVSRALGLLLASYKPYITVFNKEALFLEGKSKKGNRISRSVLRRHLQSLGFRW